jgi:ADP-ribose pyrophosphatase
MISHRIRVAGLISMGDSLLLVQQMNRHGKLLWSLPGGRLEASDEDIFRGTEREVWEETGLKVEAGPLRFVSEYLAPDMFAVTLIVECQLAAGESPQNIHLNNTQPDDHIYGVACLSRSKIISDEKAASRIFALDYFWDSLERPNGVLHLGRWVD